MAQKYKRGSQHRFIIQRLFWYKPTGALLAMNMEIHCATHGPAGHERGNTLCSASIKTVKYIYLNKFFLINGMVLLSSCQFVTLPEKQNVLTLLFDCHCLTSPVIDVLSLLICSSSKWRASRQLLVGVQWSETPQSRVIVTSWHLWSAQW